MSHSSLIVNSPTFHVPTSLLAAIDEASSYEPPRSLPATMPHTEHLHAPEAQQMPPHPDPIEDIVFRLLVWPLPSATGFVTIGLPLVIACFDTRAHAHIHYDERVHRLCLRSDSDIIWRGEQLGLPKAYVDWLSAESQKGAVNILKVDVAHLEKGLDRWMEVTGRRG